jgi:alpha-tubulin suppressor-like RCC1 family protein
VVSTPTLVTFPGFASVFVLSLTAGDHHTCAVAAGDTWCWGRNDVGQLGSGTFGGSSDVPRRVSGGHTFSVITANGNTTCGVEQSDNSVWCWGYGLTGELGNGEEGRNSAVPVRVVRP